jgi:hypothetical protein
MIKLIAKIFLLWKNGWRSPVPIKPSKPAPKPGDRWYMEWDGNPFEIGVKSPITILDVKEGWVKFKHDDYKIFTDPDSMKMSSFLYVFKPWKII